MILTSVANSDVSELVADSSPSPEFVASSADFARYEAGTLLTDEGMAEISQIASDISDVTDVLGVDVMEVPGLRDAPPIDEQTTYDPAAREDLVQSDAGPVHLHRRREDPERRGRDVIWTEADLLTPRAEMDPLTLEDPWRKVPTPSTAPAMSPAWTAAPSSPPVKKEHDDPYISRFASCSRISLKIPDASQRLRVRRVHGQDQHQQTQSPPAPPPLLSFL